MDNLASEQFVCFLILSFWHHTVDTMGFDKPGGAERVLHELIECFADLTRTRGQQRHPGLVPLPLPELPGDVQDDPP